MTRRLLARQALEDAQKAKQFAEKFIRETSAESGRHGPGNLWGISGSDAGGTGTGGGDSVLGRHSKGRFLWSDRSRFAATASANRSPVDVSGGLMPVSSTLTPPPPSLYFQEEARGGPMSASPTWLAPEIDMSAAGKDRHAYVKVRFRVRCMAGFGETLWISGNHPALGGWSPAQATQLKTSASLFPIWTATVELPLGADTFWRETPVTYRYLRRSKTGGEERWEDSIPARVCPIPEETWLMQSGVVDLGDGEGGGGRAEVEVTIEDGSFNELSPRAEAAVLQGGGSRAVLPDAGAVTQEGGGGKPAARGVEAVDSSALGMSGAAVGGELVAVKDRVETRGTCAVTFQVGPLRRVCVCVHRRVCVCVRVRVRACVPCKCIRVCKRVHVWKRVHTYACDVAGNGQHQLR